MAEDGEDVRDVIARAGEDPIGRPLLVPMMREGQRLPAGRVDLTAARTYAQKELARLPARVRAIVHADPPYPVDVSQALSDFQKKIVRDFTT
jgi:nicotinate phosphoribosyltransferase